MDKTKSAPESGDRVTTRSVWRPDLAFLSFGVYAAVGLVAELFQVSESEFALAEAQQVKLLPLLGIVMTMFAYADGQRSRPLLLLSVWTVLHHVTMGIVSFSWNPPRYESGWYARHGEVPYLAACVVLGFWWMGHRRKIEMSIPKVPKHVPWN